MAMHLIDYLIILHLENNTCILIRFVSLVGGKKSAPTVALYVEENL